MDNILSVYFPVQQVLAKQQIELLTAQAWFSENKDLEEKVID